MPEIIDESVTDESTETIDTETTDSAESEATETTDDPNAGAHKALVAERKARKTLERELNTLRAEIANKDKPAEEQAIDAARREAAAEATAKSDARLVRAELKAAAATKVKNPALALKLIDTSEIEVGEDGEVDQDALNAAIDDLLTEYPELAADAGSKFGGGADQGAKGKSAKPSQLSKQELSKLSPAEIIRADKDGRLDSLKGK